MGHGHRRSHEWALNGADYATGRVMEEDQSDPGPSSFENNESAFSE